MSDVGAAGAAGGAPGSVGAVPGGAPGTAAGAARVGGVPAGAGGVPGAADTAGGLGAVGGAGAATAGGAGGVAGAAGGAGGVAGAAGAVGGADAASAAGAVPGAVGEVGAVGGTGTAGAAAAVPGAADTAGAVDAVGGVGAGTAGGAGGAAGAAGAVGGADAASAAGAVPGAADTAGGLGAVGGAPGAAPGSVGSVGAVPAPAPARLLRFDRTERLVHWANAVLFLVLLATGAVLYIGQLSALVGRRDLVKEVHVWAGVLLPVPVVLGLMGPRAGRAFRADVGRFNRWIDDDRRWFRSLGRARGLEWGKFHPGQKANAAVVAGAIPVMLATGSIMRWYKPFPLAWRTGATFVHDWIAVLLFVLVFGHIVKALSEPDALQGMVTGSVDESWARRRHPRWHRDDT